MKFNLISKLTIGIGIFIIISASFMRQILDFTKAHIGERGFLVLVGITFIIPALLILIHIIRNKPHFINILISIILLIMGITLAWRMRIPEERIHILEYAILGWFGTRDLTKTNNKIKKIKGLVLAYAVCIAVGILDEAFQKILPNRYFDLRDIALNSLGGAWGVILYLLT